MIELMAEVQCEYLDKKEYDSLSESEKQKYRKSSEKVLEIISMIPGKVRGRITVTHELLERIFGIKEGALLNVENEPRAGTISILHCDEDSSLPVGEGLVIPVTEVFDKKSKVFMCRNCTYRDMAEAAERTFKLGEEVEVFVDGMGMKDGVIVESGSYAYRVEIDNWSALFGPMAIANKEKANEESNESDMP